MNRKERISVRLTPYQNQVLTELSTALDTSVSMLVRTIVGDFISRNEERLENIIEQKARGNADNKQISAEEEIFGEE